MNLLLLNGLLAFGWVAISGTFSGMSFLVGFLFGYVALWATRPLYGETGYFRRVPRALLLAVMVFYELVVSSLRVAWDVLTPGDRSSPAIVAVPLDAETDAEIALVANLISLTPGSLSLDYDAGSGCLIVHAMFVDDADDFRRQIKQGFERRVLEVMR